MSRQRRLIDDWHNLDLDQPSNGNSASERLHDEDYSEQLRQILPELRKSPGFPIGSDEDVLRMSDPPHYTACPNPFISEFVQRYGTLYSESLDTYHREPFASDVSEGRSDPIYVAHSYHTKVPHKAIMKYILHYTNPGDIVLDGFCGTGMTGVASQLCADASVITSLGYTVTSDGVILDHNESKVSNLGARHPILNDLSPAATFIAHNYNTALNHHEYHDVTQDIVDSLSQRCTALYLTLHEASDSDVIRSIQVLDQQEIESLTNHISKYGVIQYTVWSDVFLCASCGAEIVYWHSAVNSETGKMRDSIVCEQCGADNTKGGMERQWSTTYDRQLGRITRKQKQVPVLINYTYGGKRYKKRPDAFDEALVARIEELDIPYWFPTNEIPKGDKTSDPFSVGIRHVHEFYTARNLWIIARLRSAGVRYWFPFSALTPRSTKMHRIAVSRVGGEKQGEGGATVGIINGTLFVPSISVEMNVVEQARERIKVVRRSGIAHHPSIVSTHSSTEEMIPENSCDYIFVDPPFGSNLMYSELNILWESWLRVLTNNHCEAIENRSQRKSLVDYQRLMEACFRQFYRALKPGRWMTVEFHNSKNSVWNAIQEAIQRAGFVVADVRVLDKQQGSFNQVSSRGAVKQDLVISAYKPRLAFVDRFVRGRGSEDGAWEFVRQHLSQLPVFLEKGGRSQIMLERQAFLLYDRMVAYHLVTNLTIPLSSAEFYSGLSQRFLERDSMYFLPDQAAEYDQKKLAVSGVEQLQLFVFDESSTIQWLRQVLSLRPRTYQEIHPDFLQQLKQARHERLPELLRILEQNFLRNDLDRWYVPDANRQTDLEKLRERELLAVFDGYVASRNRLKEFRTEAVRVGFKECWRNRDYRTIVSVAERLPATVLQEDPQLLMYYDNASARVG